MGLGDRLVPHAVQVNGNTLSTATLSVARPSSTAFGGWRLALCLSSDGSAANYIGTGALHATRWAKRDGWRDYIRGVTPAGNGRRIPFRYAVMGAGRALVAVIRLVFSAGISTTAAYDSYRVCRTSLSCRCAPR